MGKVDNAKTIRGFIQFLVGIFVCVFIISWFIFFVKNNTDIGSIAFLVLIAIALTGYFLSTKCFEYEYGGECVTIKKFHPFKKGSIPPSLEFPREYLKNYVIKKELVGYKLILVLESSRKREVKKGFRLVAFNEKQIKNLRSSLSKIKEMNNQANQN